MVSPRAAVAAMPAYIPGRSGQVRPDTADLASNEMSFGPSPLAVAAATEALSVLHRYPEPHPAALAEKLAERHGLHPDQIMVANGEDELIRLLALAYLDEHAAALMPAPSFPAYRQATLVMGAEPHGIPLSADGRLDPAAYQAALDMRPANPIRLVFLCTPNNPTGGATPPAHLRPVLTQAIERGALPVVDEAYVEFVPGMPSVIAYLREGLEVLVLRTFSKAYGLAGLRIGWIAAPAPVIAILKRLREPFSVNRVAIAAAEAALQDTEHLSRVVADVAEGRARFQGEARRRRLETFPSDANFVTCRVPPGRGGANAVTARLRAHGVLVRSLATFGLQEHIRVTIGRPEEMARFWATWDAWAEADAASDEI